MAGEQAVQGEGGGSSEQELQSKEAMVDNQVQGEGEGGGGSGGVSVQELQREMEKLAVAFDAEVDKPELLHQQGLSELFGILKDNNGAVPQLPQDKKEKLAALLPNIADALKQCAPPPPEPEEEKTMSSSIKKKMKKKKAALKMGDCYPFKTTTSSRTKDANADGGSPSLSSVVSKVLQQTKDIFVPAAAAAEDDVLYEWTTSYVDEDRLYGWHEEAKEVADALVGPEEDDGVLFRAAGIYGIHGSGKTALAQRVFVHDRIKDTFPLRLWVCLGPQREDMATLPEDMATLLYRMLDNLGLDTYQVEKVVNSSAAVTSHAGDDAKANKSKIGVLLFILHVTLAKTSYLIVFDDIRAYDKWYTNLPLPPPADGVEWNDRLAYGLPKTKKSAVLVTCRKKEHARDMVRTGRVFRPPPLDGPHAWSLFDREYTDAKKKMMIGGGEYNKDNDRQLKLLEAMQKEIVGKCLGLPVAIVEAAKGFAQLPYEYDTDDDDDKSKAAAASAAASKKDDADAGEAASAAGKVDDAQKQL